jgi:hypothetical protein
MDRSYKEDNPRARRALEELKKEFSGVASTTDWTKLRIEPLLEHVKFLEQLLRSPKFSRETARLIAWPARSGPLIMIFDISRLPSPRN